MTDDRVRRIRDDVVLGEGKQTFLDTIASAYDEHVCLTGEEPVCVVFALVGETGTAKTGYHTLSPVEDRNALFVARGVQVLRIDEHTWDSVSRTD
jgi:hypothetical protein